MHLQDLSVKELVFLLEIRKWRCKEEPYSEKNNNKGVNYVFLFSITFPSTSKKWELISFYRSFMGLGREVSGFFLLLTVPFKNVLLSSCFLEMIILHPKCVSQWARKGENIAILKRSAYVNVQSGGNRALIWDILKMLFLISNVHYTTYTFLPYISLFQIFGVLCPLWK